MAEPAIPAKPFKKPNRRVMIALAAGGVLALLFLMSRRGGEPVAVEPPPEDPTSVTADPIDFPATFADNGAATAQLGEDISNALTQQSQDIADALAGIQTGGDGVSDTAEDLAALGSLATSLGLGPKQPTAKTGGKGAGSKGPKGKTKPKPEPHAGRGKPQKPSGSHRPAKPHKTKPKKRPARR